MEILCKAIANGTDVAALAPLMDLQERWEKRNARKAFDAAIAKARAEMPQITKNRAVAFDSHRTAGRTEYRYEDLAQIEKAVMPVLSKYGLSYRFRTNSDPGKPVSVTCIVSHCDGYSEENTLSAGADTSGNKSSIQAIGSAVTYLQRYTLKASLGLAVSNDDDGNTSDHKIPPVPNPNSPTPPPHPSAFKAQAYPETVTQLSSSASYQASAATLERASEQGYDALRAVWSKLDAAKKAAFEPELERLKGQARVADKRREDKRSVKDEKVDSSSVTY